MQETGDQDPRAYDAAAQRAQYAVNSNICFIITAKAK